MLLIFNTMHSHFFTLASLLLGSAIALDNWSPNHGPKALKARQGDNPGGAFIPGKDTGVGATCAAAWGDGFIQCGTGNECYNPDLGESCCENSCMNIPV